jgi:hypothetical protein
MMANLHKALNNRMALTIRLYARWLLRLVVILFSVSLLAACVPKTEEEQIAVINKQIAPDGYLTKTHLYIHWPAAYSKVQQRYTGRNDLAKAVTLKIPIEYMATTLDYPDPLTSLDKKNYSAMLTGALMMHEKEITSVYLGLLPGAKPYIPLFADKSDLKTIEQQKESYLKTAYSMILARNNYHGLSFSEIKPTDTDKEIYDLPPKVFHLAYSCEAIFGIRGRQVSIDVTKELGCDKTATPNNLNHLDKPDPAQTVQAPNNEDDKWRAKVGPAQALLNSFVLSEDSAEVKEILTAIQNATSKPWYSPN